MAIKITISNRQRGVAVNMSRVEKMTARLASSLINNLCAQPVKHLSKKRLRQIEESGVLSLVFVSNRKIREINKEWRSKDYATDVLSFPLIFDSDDLQSSSCAPGLPGLPLELGEVIISLEKTKEQAAEFGHGFERELAFLFVHGTLHILGFDHITKAQEKEMFGRQAGILKEAGFERK